MERPTILQQLPKAEKLKSVKRGRRIKNMLKRLVKVCDKLYAIGKGKDKYEIEVQREIEKLIDGLNNKVPCIQCIGSPIKQKEDYH
jgi:hypothetical protein